MLEEEKARLSRERELKEKKIAADKAKAEILALQAKDAAVAASAAEKAREEAENARKL